MKERLNTGQAEARPLLDSRAQGNSIKRKTNSLNIEECEKMKTGLSRIILGAMRGNSGKTLLSVGLSAYYRKKGMIVSTFKKGPDYIDAAWLELASGNKCYNLDAFLMKKENVLAKVKESEGQSEFVLIEGNRGIYDGYDLKGSYSTAELAKILNTPIILIADCSMATRTVAAMVIGCQNFDPEVPIKGVILNRTAGKRHRSVITEVIEERCRIPVLGALPKINETLFPDRHMGLISPYEYPNSKEATLKAAEIVERYLDTAGIFEIAKTAEPVELLSPTPIVYGTEEDILQKNSKRLRIGYVKDSAFWFYYRDNLEALEKMGATLIECNALVQDRLPPVDALYIGGGFPETHTEALSANSGFRKSVRRAVENGLPVYAECGGLIYLGEKIILKERTYPMAGVLPLTFILNKKPQGHGYTILKVDKSNPYFSTGSALRGHEFHYSQIVEWGDASKYSLVLKIEKGYGCNGDRDGIVYKNVFAAYSHLHALGVGEWAKGLYKQALHYSQKNAE